MLGVGAHKTNNGAALRRTLRAAFLPLALLAAAGVAAQEPPETTGDPRRPAPEVERPKPAPIEQAPRRTAAPAAGGAAIRVTRFTFTGNTVFSEAELAPLVADYTTRPVTLLEIYEAADRITDHYVKHGYTLASATVPAQKVADGTVQLEVVEGRIASVTTEGTRFYTPAQITDNLGTFRAGEIYRGDQLSDGLRRLNRLPGLEAKAVVQPGEAYGTSNLLIRAEEQAINATLAVDNHGRPNLGEIRTSLAGSLNNPFRLEDQVQLLALVSEDAALTYGMLGYSLPLWNQGPRLGLSYAQADFEVTGVVPVDGENKTARAGLDIPVIDTADDALFVTIGASHTEANTDLAGTPITATQVPLYDLGASFSHVYGTLAVTQLSVGLQSNFESQGEVACALAQCESQELRTEVDFQHLQPIWGRLDAYVRGTWVYSDDSLPEITQFSVGGPNSVRGFAAAEIRGDRGTFGTLGLRQGFRAGPVTLHLRAFGDTGQVERVVPLGPEKDSLTSAGAGIDVLWMAGAVRVAGKADWSKPLDSHVDDPSPFITERDDQRFFATIAVSY